MASSLNDIALFVEVAKARSFTRAAEVLRMPASTVSRRLSELERYIGVRLLNRSTRKVELTEAGAVYFERCLQIVTEARIAHEQLTDAVQKPKGRLRISMPSSFAITYLPLALQEFGRLYPDIQCEYDLGIHSVDMMSDPFDIVIRLGRQPDSGVISRLITHATLGLYASADYLKKNGMPAHPADLVQHACLRASSSKYDSEWRLLNGNQEAVVAVSGQLAVNNVAMLTQMALLGAGIVPLSTYWLARSADAGGLVRVLPEWEFEPIPLVAMFPSRLMPAKTRVFIDFLVDTLSESRMIQHAAQPLSNKG